MTSIHLSKLRLVPPYVWLIRDRFSFLDHLVLWSALLGIQKMAYVLCEGIWGCSLGALFEAMIYIGHEDES